MKKQNNIHTVELIISDKTHAKKRLEQYKKLGLKIAYFRKKKGLTQMELAELINISRTYISNIEAPKSVVNPTMEIIFDIADALDIPVIKLFDDTL